MGPIKFLYNSKINFTAKSLITNTVIITRVLCNLLIPRCIRVNLKYNVHVLHSPCSFVCLYWYIVSSIKLQVLHPVNLYGCTFMVCCKSALCYFKSSSWDTASILMLFSHLVIVSAPFLKNMT